MINPVIIRKDFSVLRNNGKLVYLDSAATSLKPDGVINKITEYYKDYPANIHRGIYDLSERATAEYESTREAVASFIGASSGEIIFTKNTTESINLIAYSLRHDLIEAHDEIVATVVEHHSNYVPWQQLAKRKQAVFKTIDTDDNGILDSRVDRYVTKKTKILALSLVSNVLGTIHPVKRIIDEARRINPSIIVVVDAAQAIAHIPVAVTDIDCDFMAFSAHKMFGPTGVGVLWGKKERLEDLGPFMTGGGMIENVSQDDSTFVKVPGRFEAGTPNIADISAYKASIEYIKSIGGIKEIAAYENALTRHLIDELSVHTSFPVSLVGSDSVHDRIGVVAFNLDGIHPHDVAELLNESNICVRAGHHCAMPLHKRLNCSSSVRVSLSVYNTKDDIDRFIFGLKKTLQIFSKK